MNNAVYVGRHLYGFRCLTCGDVFQSMWGCTCNGCRQLQRNHNESIKEIQELRATIAKLTSAPVYSENVRNA